MLETIEMMIKFMAIWLMVSIGGGLTYLAWCMFRDWWYERD